MTILNKFVKSSTDEALLKAMSEGKMTVDQEELNKAMNKAGLTQKQVTVHGKNGDYQAMKWVKASDDKKATDKAPKSVDKKDSKTKEVKPSEVKIGDVVTLDDFGKTGKVIRVDKVTINRNSIHAEPGYDIEIETEDGRSYSSPIPERRGVSKQADDKSPKSDDNKDGKSMDSSQFVGKSYDQIVKMLDDAPDGTTIKGIIDPGSQKRFNHNNDVKIEKHSGYVANYSVGDKKQESWWTINGSKSLGFAATLSQVMKGTNKYYKLRDSVDSTTTQKPDDKKDSKPKKADNKNLDLSKLRNGSKFEDDRFKFVVNKSKNSLSFQAVDKKTGYDYYSIVQGGSIGGLEINAEVPGNHLLIDLDDDIKGVNDSKEVEKIAKKLLESYHKYADLQDTPQPTQKSDDTSNKFIKQATDLLDEAQNDTRPGFNKETGKNAGVLKTAGGVLYSCPTDNNKMGKAGTKISRNKAIEKIAKFLENNSIDDSSDDIKPSLSDIESYGYDANGAGGNSSFIRINNMGYYKTGENEWKSNTASISDSKTYTDTQISDMARDSNEKVTVKPATEKKDTTPKGQKLSSEDAKAKSRAYSNKYSNSSMKEKQAFMDTIKANGITWTEKNKDGSEAKDYVQWMRACMALTKHFREGGSFDENTK